MNEPALLELFNSLREAGLPIGLAEYNLLLEAISGGFGTRDRDALAQLCRALWVKSQREEQIFQNYFDQIIIQQSEQVFIESETEKPSLINQKKQITPRKKAARIPRFLLLGFTTCIVVIGCAFFLKFLEEKTEPQISRLDFRSSFPLEFLGNSIFSADISQEAADIKVIRTGSRHGLVSAKLNIGKKCLQYDSNDTSIVSDTPQVVQFANGKLEKIIQFADGEAEKIIKIPIINKDSVYFVEQRIILCLTDPKGGINLDNQKKAVLIIQNNNYWRNFLYFNILEALLTTSTCIILLFVAWRIWKIRQIQDSGDEVLTRDAYTNLPKTILSPEVIRTMADEIEVAKAIRQSDKQLSELFPLIVNDLPITHRQMKQAWRYLRQFSREGPPIELDIEATIKQVTQQGVLINPVLVPQRNNRIELLLLIDRDSSMIPFHHFSQELIDTALYGGRFSRVQVYYFHNCPDEYLYRDPYHLDAKLIDDCLLNLAKGRTVCLIFSDAGAARGGFSSRRRRLTKFFLKSLRQYVRYTAWLNPIPRGRWENTTAHEIAALVPMFEVNRQEFYKAIDVLRGRYKPWGLT